MRKLLTAVMAVTMTVSLAACSGKNALKTDSFLVASTVQMVQSEQKKVYTGKTGTIAMALTTGTSEEDGMEKDVMSYICGGYEINQGSTMIEDNPEAKVAFEKATECLAGATFEPVAYLGKQIVAGTNYSFLCRMTPSYPGSEGSFVIVIVYEELEGNAEISVVEDIDISASEGVEEETQQETEPEYGIFEGESASVQMASPWSAYEKIEDAVEASGVSFIIPEELNGEKVSLIQAMKGICEARYGKKHEIQVRKGSGLEDISGDYNVYNEITKINISDKEVTFRGNDGKIYGAVWNDGTNSYALYVEAGSEAEKVKSAVLDIISADK